MLDKPLMPKATAVWLLENTSLTFKQIADFCQLHELEIKGIADGDVAVGIKAYNPILANQLTREEIEECSKDPNRSLSINKKVLDYEIKTVVGPKYTPLSKRQDRPDAIAWLIKNYPQLSEGQISKLVGTTTSTVDSVKSRKHWNIANITPKDPVALNLCTQNDLQKAVEKANRRVESQKKAKLKFVNELSCFFPNTERVMSIVSIVMGSKSDWSTLKKSAEILKKLKIQYIVKIVSAHRTPMRLVDFAKSAKKNNLAVIIAGAGGSAHLPGMIAAITDLPVIGVPMETKSLKGLDSLLSIVQMPFGIPVGTVAIGETGAKNAAL